MKTEIKYNPFTDNFDLIRSEKIPIFLDENSTINDIVGNEVHYYIGKTNKIFDFDLLPYPSPIPTQQYFDIVNLSQYDCNITSGGGSFSVLLTYLQGAKDITIPDSGGGSWGLEFNTYNFNIPTFQQVTEIGNETTNTTYFRNPSVTQELQVYHDGFFSKDIPQDREVWYNSRFIRKSSSNSKSFFINFPDVSINANNSVFDVNFRPNVSGTIAYLSDITTQQKSDWNATSGVTQILNKPNVSLATNVGKILYVSIDAPLSNNSQTRTQALGRIDRPFQSIQSAINAANNGDTIVIFSGTYNETVSITYPLYAYLTLNFVGIGNVVIDNFIFGFNSIFKIDNITFNYLRVNSYYGSGCILLFNNCKLLSYNYYSTGDYQFDNCELGGHNGLGNNGYNAFFRYNNCRFTGNEYYYYNNAYGFNTGTNLIYQNCEFKKVTLQGDGGLVPNLVQFIHCKFISPDTYNVDVSGIAPTNILMLNCTSNKPIHPAVTNVNNFYNNSIIE